MNPELSVIIPVRSDELPSDTVAGLTRACQDFPLIEVIVVKGNALGKQRNEAVALAKAPLVYFIDDDSQVEPDGLKEGLKLFGCKDIDVVGGPAVTRKDAAFLERCFGEVVSVPLGAWRMRARMTPSGPPRQVDGEELIFCNLMMRKSRYLEASGMDEGLYPGEDVDLMRRLRKQGAEMYYNPHMKIARPRRISLFEFMTQYYGYGRGRGERILHDFRSKDLIFFVPSLFAMYLISLSIVCNSLTFLPLLLYILLSALNGLLIAFRTRSLLTGFVSSFLFLPLHLSYGSGVVAGVNRSLFRRINKRIPELKVTIIELAYGEGLN
ncbi:MAG: glycosyltransferase [Candidatus Obscuribacterales bacterium]|nr:glycosyltransferase [Candidatus Obscuribacterales bacterium]